MTTALLKVLRMHLRIETCTYVHTYVCTYVHVSIRKCIRSTLSRAVVILRQCTRGCVVLADVHVLLVWMAVSGFLTPAHPLDVYRDFLH